MKVSKRTFGMGDWDNPDHPLKLAVMIAILLLVPWLLFAIPEANASTSDEKKSTDWEERCPLQNTGFLPESRACQAYRAGKNYSASFSLSEGESFGVELGNGAGWVLASVSGCHAIRIVTLSGGELIQSAVSFEETPRILNGGNGEDIAVSCREGIIYLQKR